jgi:hypothetical protein
LLRVSRRFELWLQLMPAGQAGSEGRDAPMQKSRQPRFEFGTISTRAGDSGFAGLVTEIQQETYRKLGWLALVISGLVLARLLTSLLLIDLPSLQSAVSIASIVMVIGSIGFAFLCLKGAPKPSRFPALALGYEAFVSLGLGTMIMNWQNRLGDGGWFFGAMPVAGVWVILFANVVPLSPFLHLLGGSFSTLGIAFWFFLSLSVYDIPAAIGPSENLRVFLQLMSSMGVGVAIGYLCAGRVYGISRDLSRAQRLGSYFLTEKLGQGGMGEVWKARHRMLARPAAVKLIRGAMAGQTSSETLLQRFEREVQATATLRSPHTIDVYDYGTREDGTFYYVMELLDGIDLEELVQKHGPQSPERVVHILRQACHSLGEAHEAGLVHRDIKPANIYLCRYGREVDYVKILDFGMVKGEWGDASLTQVGTFAGTPHYASPEMASGLVDQIDGRSDIYALGVVAFRLLTARPLFEGESAMQVLMKHVHDEPERASKYASTTPPALDELILDCLKKQPAERVASADELDARLKTIERSCPWSMAEAREWWESQAPKSGDRLEIEA